MKQTNTIRDSLFRLSFLFIFLCPSICNAQMEIPAPVKGRQEMIISHNGFTISYDVQRRTANWSAWMLVKSHLGGQETRANNFRSDSAIPLPYRGITSDYTGTGYDRGHLCPAADMTWSSQAMQDCFLMSNICPQDPTLNRVSWKELETACRRWVLTEDTLYIVCGPVYSGSSHKEIGSHRIRVPDGYFKCILSLKKGSPKSIGFYYTNTSDDQPMKTSAMTVDKVEALTGLDFFPSLPDNIERVVESRYSILLWK